MNALTEIYGGFKSLLIGMRITLGQFFKPTVTVRYPHQALTMPPRYRGHIELVGNPETGKPLCFVCKLCQKACPSGCITVDGTKLEGDKRKSVNLYLLDFTKCSLCGSCVEVCREGAIRFSRDYNLAALSKDEFHFDLVLRFWAQQGKPVPVPVPAQGPKDAAPAAKSEVPSPKPAGLPELEAGAARAAESKPEGQLAGTTKNA
jgi:NADH-quinone oxidoreductase subunit I